MFYLLHKKRGESSFQAIKKFAKNQKILKVGHTGTLDPFATGLLLVATDEDTKLISYIADKNKTYEAEIKFGSQTDTYDLEGEIINFSTNKIEEKDLIKIIEWLEAQDSQIPPIYSAKKIDGIRSYELARKKIKVDLKPQKIKVENVKIEKFNFDEQTLKIALSVSNGTFIRSLANDLAIAFNTYGHLISLKRIIISDFNISLLNNKEFVKIENAPAFAISTIFLAAKEIKKLKNGFSIKTFLDLKDNEEYLIVDEENKANILGIVYFKDNEIKVKKLFGNKLTKY